MKELEPESEHLRKAAFDPTLEMPILAESAIARANGANVCCPLKKLTLNVPLRCSAEVSSGQPRLVSMGQ